MLVRTSKHFMTGRTFDLLWDFFWSLKMEQWNFLWLADKSWKLKSVDNLNDIRLKPRSVIRFKPMSDIRCNHKYFRNFNYLFSPTDTFWMSGTR